MKELVAAAKAKPGEMTFASTGVGSPPHLDARTVPERRRREVRARAVSRRGAGADRSARRPGAGVRRRRAGADVADQGRQDQGARRGVRPAQSDAAGRADAGRAGLSRHHRRQLVRPAGAGQDAARGHRQDQRRVRQGDQRSGGQEEADRFRRRSRWPTRRRSSANSSRRNTTAGARWSASAASRKAAS